MIASVNVANTGGWQSWVSTTVNTTAVTGVHRLYLTFTGASSADFVNVNWFQFSH